MYLRGRGAGGSSSVNAMAAIRGMPDDYERWVREFGCVGWGWDEMLETFVAIEDDVDYGDKAGHGRGGPLPLARQAPDEMAPLDRVLCAAFSSHGHPTCDDYHAPGATGISRWALTMRHGERVSTNDAYLEAARTRPNLTVRGDTLVDRVLLEGRRAGGVRTADGEEIDAGEVIVSAGTVHSPAILLRSGIGGDEGLPVGASLKDHASAWLQLALRPGGRKRSNDGPVIHSMVRYSSQLADAGPNDMQLIWCNAIGTEDEGVAVAALGAAVMRVFSHGTLRLRSNDPRHDPALEFYLLSDDRDLRRLRDGVRRLIDITTDPAVADIVESVSAGALPVAALDSNAAIDEWLLTSVLDYVHPVGTCRMGRIGDPGAVVDTTCNVIGYDRLRVCDASVMPDLPKANTNLTTIAIAERLAATMSP